MVESTAADAHQQSSETRRVASGFELLLARLSIADGLYVLIVFAAAIMRLAGLGAAPLSPTEAQHALASWQFLQAGPYETAVISPAYNTFTSLLVYLQGVSDSSARLIPAIFGVGLVMLPWLLRNRLGKTGMLVTAALFAASPLLSAVSRTAGGEAIALFAILLLFIAATRVQDHAGNFWAHSLGGAVGLGITSAPLFYSGLVTLAMAWFVQRLVAPGEPSDTSFGRRTISKMLLSAAITAAVLSTRLFTDPSGIGASAQILANWLGEFSLQGNVHELIAPFLALGRYEILLLALGVFAVIWTVWRNHPLGTLLTYWLFALMIIMLLQRGILANALVMPLPGYLLLGLASQKLLQSGQIRFTWTVWGIITMTGAVALVNMARFLRVSLVEQQVANLWIAVMAIALAILFMYYFWSEKQRAIMQGVWLGVLFLLLLFAWGTAWNLTHTSATDPRENWISEATNNDIRGLVTTLRDISRKASNSDYDLPLFSAVDSPALRWYLRDFNRAQFGQAIPLASRYEIIISPASIVEPALGEDYFGADFGLLRRESDENVNSATPLLDGLRWVLFHESNVGFDEDRIILWVRSDLGGAP